MIMLFDICSLEIEYKHLLTSWKANYSSLRRTLKTQEVSSRVKILELPEKVCIMLTH
jgi:hypothetical protein